MREYSCGLMQVADVATAPERRHRLYWWKEALIVAVFYAVYSAIRNQFGSNEIAADGVPEQAFTNAERIIEFQLWMGMFHEQTVQSWFLPYDWFIKFWNTYYGTAHFFVTLGVFILLFVKRADVFPQWRNTLAAMTALAIIGFAWFPLMPPRLLDEPCPRDDPSSYGGACIESDLRPEGGWGFVDTLVEFGGPWSFESETMASISNQYAAMPSLHIGWSTWCAIAVWPLLRRRWTKCLVLLYPAATLFGIVVTANHYWIDGVGGIIVFGIGALIGWGVHRWNQERLDRQFALTLEPPAPSAPDTIVATAAAHADTTDAAVTDALADTDTPTDADSGDTAPTDDTVTDVGSAETPTDDPSAQIPTSDGGARDIGRER